MKRSSIVLPFALLAAVGCSGQIAPQATDSTATPAAQTVPGEDASLTLVSLKVPNMH